LREHRRPRHSGIRCPGTRRLRGSGEAGLAETRDTSVSIQAIAERADVGFGSFYDHFESKTEMFDASRLVGRQIRLCSLDRCGVHILLAPPTGAGAATSLSPVSEPMPGLAH
jgi:hypothetical protein